MVFSFRNLPYSVPGAVNLGGVPSSAEVTIYRDARLLGWWRAGVSDDATRVVDRARGQPMSKTTRAARPVTTTGVGIYNNQKYLAFIDSSETQELRSDAEILPATTAWTIAFVGHFKAGVAARYALFGNDAASSALAWYLGINDSNGRIELKNSDNTIWTTGSGAFAATSNVPFLAIVGHNPATGQFGTRCNRSHSHGRTAVTGNVGTARRLQFGTTGGDAFGRANPARGAGIAEAMLFDGYLLDDNAAIANIEAVLGDRYGFAA